MPNQPSHAARLGLYCRQGLLQTRGRPDPDSRALARKVTGSGGQEAQEQYLQGTTQAMQAL